MKSPTLYVGDKVWVHFSGGRKYARTVLAISGNVVKLNRKLPPNGLPTMITTRYFS